ncbi:MAG: YebC/PmpR family DNA-binding transcriptional regulator [Spirochaetae bacterium HGW-Spirochaetae-10]|nr:MAG: YebC/PmpR family DNA-binding transcriptional regulator [Spirochaetae bacterium HGW-Spirochaetae-10]
MAGHSKWANIKHRKDGADRRRGRIFTKLSKELMVSARLGGSDPDANPRLRIAMTKARSANMTTDTIERAIKKGAGELEGLTYEDVFYEIYAPGGVGVIVEAMTDKKSRTTPEIKSMLNRFGGSLAESNAVTRLFMQKGQILIEKKAVDEDRLMELAIESGAEDVRVDEDGYEVLTAPADFASVNEALVKAGLEIQESGIKYLPLDGTEVPVDAEQASKTMKLLELLEDHDDVQAVYHNMQMSDEIMEALS